jgi:hypothetical protein
MQAPPRRFQFIQGIAYQFVDRRVHVLEMFMVEGVLLVCFRTSSRVESPWFPQMILLDSCGSGSKACPPSIETSTLPYFLHTSLGCGLFRDLDRDPSRIYM